MKWIHQSTHDTGNGALIHRSTSRAYPAVIRREFHSYCGREANQTWYEAEGDQNRTQFRSAKAAQEWHKRMPVS